MPCVFAIIWPRGPLILDLSLLLGVELIGLPRLGCLKPLGRLAAAALIAPIPVVFRVFAVCGLFCRLALPLFLTWRCYSPRLYLALGLVFSSS